ncbi:MAG: 4'-phosphopantetheinyl transferase superfamily protein [Desulfopila sp.]|jgi:phosphopantetheinyl transferase|nr:4'-phosphopantetheinyl transferase superfamily protein [Desulfopila sp.]
MSIKQVLESNIFPDTLQQVSVTVFPGIRFAAILLKIETCCHSAYHDEGLSLWLSPRERKQFAAYTFAKRKSEWLAGRISAKLAAASVTDTEEKLDYSTLEIANQPGGRPYIHFLHVPPYHSEKLDISISHSSTLAAALAADHYCGIDVQVCRKTLLRVRERFCLKSEALILESFFPDSPEESSLNILWSAKEALRKALSYQGVPEFLQIILKRIESDTMECFSLHFSCQGRSIRVACGRHNDFALALCML